MAAKKSPGSEKYFSFPKFDRKAFLDKEIRDAKVSFISLGLAAIMAITSLLVAKFVMTGPAILIGFAGPFALYYLLPTLGIDVSEFERKNWIGPGIITFFAWLGLFILFSNPPFQDLAHPKIQDFRIYEESDPEFKLIPRGNTSHVLQDNHTHLIVVRITDNWEITKVGLEVYQGGLLMPSFGELEVLEGTGFQVDKRYNITYPERYEGYYYQVLLPADTFQPGQYRFHFMAEDGKGNDHSYSWMVDVV